MVLFLDACATANASATYFSSKPMRYSIAFFSESGTLSIIVLRAAASFSYFVASVPIATCTYGALIFNEGLVNP